MFGCKHLSCCHDLLLDKCHKNDSNASFTDNDSMSFGSCTRIRKQSVLPHDLWVQNRFVSHLVFLFLFMCFSNISEKQLVYHCHCTSQLYPSSLNHTDKAEPRCLLPSFLTGHQHSSTDCIIGVNNQTNQYVMPSTGFLLSCLSFRSSPLNTALF